MGKRHGHQVGVEAKIEYHPALDVIGVNYESWRRTALNWLQDGLTEDEVEKRLQKEFNIQWGWADSIATEAKQVFNQLRTAKENNINRIKDNIKAKVKKAKTTIKELEKTLKSATRKGFQSEKSKNKFASLLLGLKSKILKIASLKGDLSKLESTKRLHICFGSRKLFNAQYHNEENGYTNHEEWLEDWRKKRAGRFYCVGKSSYGGGTMINIYATLYDGKYMMRVQVPRCLQEQWGKYIEACFTVDDRSGRMRRADLEYAIDSQKPITTQVFRRECKDDTWYIHLTTYVQDIPTVHGIKNGCLGIDFNADSLSVTYVKPDGNIAWCHDFSYQWKGLTNCQRQARMRDLVCEIVRISESLGCGIAIESLDFSKRKARMSEESKLYNEMLSNLSTSVFKTALESRCKRFGVQLIKVNPAFTSIIGMIKFMAKYGLNSGTAAAMSIARRAMKMSEAIPQCLSSPVDDGKHLWSAWNRVSRFIKKHGIRRTQLFQWMKALEGILNPEHLSPSLQVDIDKSTKNPPIHRGEVRPDGNVQFCLFI